MTNKEVAGATLFVAGIALIAVGIVIGARAIVFAVVNLIRDEAGDKEQ